MDRPRGAGRRHAVHQRLARRICSRGPSHYNKSFYSISYQLGRQSRDNQTLLNASALGLRTSGFAYRLGHVDFLEHPRRARRADVAGPAPADRLSDNGSVFGSVDFIAAELGDAARRSASRSTATGTTESNRRRRQRNSNRPSGDRVNWGGGDSGARTAATSDRFSANRSSASMFREPRVAVSRCPGGAC